MSKNMQAAEDQNPESNPTKEVSGEYPVLHENGAENLNSPVSVRIPVEKVEPEELPAFSSRDTLADPNEVAPVSAPIESGQRKIARQTSELLNVFKKDDRLAAIEGEDNNSFAPGTLDDAMRAWDEQTAQYQKIDAKLTKEVEHHILDQQRSVAHFNLTRRSRGFFTKLGDFAKNVWSGATPEETAKGRQGIGGVRGMFLTDAQRHQEILQRAGITPQEVKTVSAPKPIVQAKPSVGSRVTSAVGSFFKNIFNSNSSTPPPKQPAGVSRKGRYAVLGGAMIMSAGILGASTCGKNCTHDGHPPIASGTGGSADSGLGGGDAASSATAVASAAPTATAVATDEPAPTVAPVPNIDLDKDEKANKGKVPVAKTAPQKAKISTLPKTTVLPKEPKEPKVEPKKEVALELKDCKDDAKMKDSDMDKCLVKAEDAEKLRKSFYDQVEEQKKALVKVYEPIKKGPEYISNKDVGNPEIYKRSESSIYFLEGQEGPVDPANPKPMIRVNGENKKIVEDALVAVSKKIADAKTPKDFYDVTEFLANIGIRIDSLIAERGKQIAAAYDTANQLNAHHIKGKIDEVQALTGKTINPVGADKVNGATVTHSTIDLPMTKQLLEGNETDMLVPALGDDPDKVISSVQKKLEYYRGLLQVNTDLDRLRVKSSPRIERRAKAGEKVYTASSAK